MKGETELYRHFDAEGNLLYVGISLSSVARLCEHKSEAEWFRQIAWVSIERFPTRDDASRAEAVAILVEHPVHNLNNAYDPPNYRDNPLLTAEKVVEMRARVIEGAKIVDVAMAFGVSRMVANTAVRGQTWKHVPGAVPKQRKRTPAEIVMRVKRMLLNGDGYDTISGKVGVSQRMVSRIATGERHSKASYGRPRIHRRKGAVPIYPKIDANQNGT